jgi:hypothetical protein
MAWRILLSNLWVPGPWAPRATNCTKPDLQCLQTFRAFLILCLHWQRVGTSLEITRAKVRSENLIFAIFCANPGPSMKKGSAKVTKIQWKKGRSVRFRC